MPGINTTHNQHQHQVYYAAGPTPHAYHTHAHPHSPKLRPQKISYSPSLPSSPQPMRPASPVQHNLQHAQSHQPPTLSHTHYLNSQHTAILQMPSPLQVRPSSPQHGRPTPLYATPHTPHNHLLSFYPTNSSSTSRTAAPPLHPSSKTHYSSHTTTITARPVSPLQPAHSPPTPQGVTIQKTPMLIALQYDQPPSPPLYGVAPANTAKHRGRQFLEPARFSICYA